MTDAHSLAEHDLACYAVAMWPQFELPAHIRLLIAKLEAVERGDICRLMIFVPPRHGKSAHAISDLQQANLLEVKRGPEWFKFLSVARWAINCKMNSAAQLGQRKYTTTSRADAATVKRELESVLAAVADLPVEELPRMIGQLREVEAVAMSRLMRVSTSSQRGDEPEDRLLDVEEAARRLAVSEDYLYRHWKELPFARKYDWGVRFSSKGIDDHIRRTQRR